MSDSHGSHSKAVRRRMRTSLVFNGQDIPRAAISITPSVLSTQSLVADKGLYMPRSSEVVPIGAAGSWKITASRTPTLRSSDLPSTTSTSRISSSVSGAVSCVRTVLISPVTATGEEQSPIHNQIGKAIVDACVRAGKEGRRFRVIVILPAIPGFAGDLRTDAAAGTRSALPMTFYQLATDILKGHHGLPV